MSLRIKVKGHTVIRGNIHRMGAISVALAKDALAEEANRVAKEMVINADSEMTLKNPADWGVNVAQASGNRQVIGPAAKLGKVPIYTEYGTVPHPITATKAPFLFFWWAKFGLFFKGLKVNHPGIRRPRLYVTKTYNQAEPTVGRRIEDIFRRAFPK
jgi:hypothetical protein